MKVWDRCLSATMAASLKEVQHIPTYFISSATAFERCGTAGPRYSFRAVTEPTGHRLRTRYRGSSGRAPSRTVFSHSGKFVSLLPLCVRVSGGLKTSLINLSVRAFDEAASCPPRFIFRLIRALIPSSPHDPESNLARKGNFIH